MRTLPFHFRLRAKYLKEILISSRSQFSLPNPKQEQNIRHMITIFKTIMYA